MFSNENGVSRIDRVSFMVPSLESFRAPPGLSLVLASTSPRRCHLLEEVGIRFKVVPPEVEETEGDDAPHLTPAEIALNNAFRKARAVSHRYPDQWVIGVDTIVVYQGRVIGKPRDIAHARDILDLLNGRKHEVISAVFCIREQPFHQMPFYDVSRVTFRRLSDSERDGYLERIDPFDKAGAYAVQEETDFIIEKIEGSRSNVMGLPVEKLMEVLTRIQKHTSVHGAPSPKS